VVALPAGRWDEIKKAQPQVKTDVEPIQANEAERIRNDLVAFGTKVGRVGGGVRAHVCVCVCADPALRARLSGALSVCVCVCVRAYVCVLSCWVPTPIQHAQGCAPLTGIQPMDACDAHTLVRVLRQRTALCGARGGLLPL